jgi:hypothetical protein
MFAHGQPDSLTTRDMGAHTPPEAQVYIHAMVMLLIIALVSNRGKGMIELGNTSLTKLLRDGAVEVTVDPKFPQAIGLESILQSVTTFGNFKWRILPNDSNDSLFFTSDFPAAIEKTDDLRILNRIVPLAPNLVLRIRPNLTLDRGSVPDLLIFLTLPGLYRRVVKRGHARLVQDRHACAGRRAS